jgi:hypothetical protein
MKIEREIEREVQLNEQMEKNLKQYQQKQAQEEQEQEQKTNIDIYMKILIVFTRNLLKNLDISNINTIPSREELNYIRDIFKKIMAELYNLQLKNEELVIGKENIDLNNFIFDELIISEIIIIKMKKLNSNSSDEEFAKALNILHYKIMNIIKRCNNSFEIFKEKLIKEKHIRDNKIKNKYEKIDREIQKK